MAESEELGVPHHGGASVAIGALTALIVGAAALVLGIVPWQQAGVAVLAVMTVLALGFVYTRSLASAAVGGQSHLVAAIAMVGFAPVIGHAALRSLETPMAEHVGGDPADATAAVLVALLCFASACSVAWRIGARPRPRVVATFRVAALAAVASCVVLVVFAAADARIAPAPRDYASALPVVAELPSVAVGDDRFWETRPLVDEVGLHGFALGRSCIGGQCYAHVRREGLVRTIGPRLPQDTTLTLHHDAPAQSIVLVGNDRVIATMDSTLSGFEWSTPSPVSVARSVSAPRSFIGLALMALLGAAAGFFWRRTLMRRLALITKARDAFVTAAGWLRLEDGSLRRLIESDADSGPTVVVEANAPTAYRGARAVGPFSLHRGIRRELVARLSLDVATADAIMCSWVLALSAPLIVAAIVGLLG